MVASNTLLIKHLPRILVNEEKIDFLKHFGAVEVKLISSKVNKYNIAFARFENEKIAENVLHRLHQITLLGSCLSVEYVRKNNIEIQLPEQNNVSVDSRQSKANENYYTKFIDKLMSWNTGNNFKQPIPSQLKYQYPPPNSQTLLNIIKILATVPKFYTQVLHLMNKMNLPCPFDKDILPDLQLNIFPLNKAEENKRPVEDEKNPVTDESSESEISSDEEYKIQKETIPEQINIRKKTKIKVPKFVKPQSIQSDGMKKNKKTLYEEVFEKITNESEPKKIKVSHPIVNPDNTQKSLENTSKLQVSSCGFGFIEPTKKVIAVQEHAKDVRDEREEERLEKEQIVCISEAQLAENRISEKDRSILPVFKNYAEGPPTCRLYIKNLAKTVTFQDLRHIYYRYLPTDLCDEPNMFDIRVMQEGRMKGQAFVTLQSVELAQKALKETNGYILKEKPLVVQFARSATK